jgi:hypothetical protein
MKDCYSARLAPIYVFLGLVAGIGVIGNARASELVNAASKIVRATTDDDLRAEFQRRFEARISTRESSAKEFGS